ncbi:MAG: hypothetical protein ACREHD_08080 [Pirellulales bacterium]
MVDKIIELFEHFKGVTNGDVTAASHLVLAAVASPDDLDSIAARFPADFRDAWAKNRQAIAATVARYGCPL